METVEEHLNLREPQRPFHDRANGPRAYGHGPYLRRLGAALHASGSKLGHGEMGEKQPRPFTLLDGMVVIASTAVGFGGIAFLGKVLVDLSAPLTLDLWRLFLASLPMLASWSVACVALRLRQPRPPFHELMLQPGTVACTCALSYLLISSVPLVVLSCMGKNQFLLLATLPFLLGQVGSAVTCVWLVQVLGKRWRPEASWLDRWGRLLGVSWILWTIYASVYVVGMWY